MQIKNGIIRHNLTTTQARFVRMYSKSKTVKDMAEALKVPRTRIYSFLKKENLEFIKTQSARRSGQIKEVKKGLFNPFAHANWIV